MQSIFALCVTFLLMNEVYSMAIRSVQYAPRSVPGRIKSSADPYSLKDYFLNYLSTVRQHQQPQYGMPEYEPPYLDSFYNKHQISPEALSALLPYISDSNSKDYSYDYNSLPNSETDDETWYDDPDELNTGERRNSQDAALLHLFLDHLQGKYSLEDLQTLEREAAIEDNNEYQLQALMAKKKTALPILNFLPPAQAERIPFRQGQKEEFIMQPATAIRRPVFARSHMKQQKRKTPTETLAAKDVKKEKMSKKSTESDSKQNATPMEPMEVKTAYHSLRKYLDRERMLRQAADDEEMTHTPRKRFISEPKALTEQLVNLKKTVS